MDNKEHCHILKKYNMFSFKSFMNYFNPKLIFKCLYGHAPSLHNEFVERHQHTSSQHTGLNTRQVLHCITQNFLTLHFNGQAGKWNQSQSNHWQYATHLCTTLVVKAFTCLSIADSCMLWWSSDRPKAQNKVKHWTDLSVQISFSTSFNLMMLAAPCQDYAGRSGGCSASTILTFRKPPVDRCCK